MGKVYNIAPRVEFEPLPTGEYVIRLLKYQEVAEERDSAFSKKGDLRIEFHWEVEVPGEGDEQRRDWAAIPQTWAKKSKFVRIAVALGLVRDEDAAESGAAIDWDHAIGRRCVASIVRKVKEGSTDWTDTITAYMPLDKLPAARGRRAQVQAAAPVEDGDIPF